MQKLYGKPLDVATFKKPVLQDIGGHLDKIRQIVTYLAENEESVSQATCYICGGEARTPLTEIHDFSYVTCTNCGHTYTTRRYSDDAIRRFYETNSYWAEVTYANKETCFYRRDNVAKPKAEYAEKHMGRTSGRWLDVGAGIGDLVSVAQERGWQAHGLELSETSVNFAKDVFGIEMTRQTMDEYLAANPELKGAHDMVSMVGVLEHVVDPIGLLGEAAQALAPGGHVMVQVPNANSIASMVQSVFPENVFRHMSPIEHIMLFSEASLVRAFERTGFEPIAMWFHGLDIYELLTNICLVNDRAVGSPLYERLIEMFNELQQVVDEKELSDRIICVARKV